MSQRGVWVVLALILACGGGPRPLRFAGLQTGVRKLHLEHGIELFEAKNGMQIALLPDQRTNLVAVDVRYLVGGAEDPDGRKGLAHLVEHLMFEAGPHEGPTIGAMLSEVSLYYNAFTTADQTHFTTTALASHLQELLAIEARRMQVGCDQIDPERFERERDVVLAEDKLRRGRDADLHDELALNLWGPDHPYGRSWTSAEVEQATRDEACDFIDHYYGPERAILVVTGNFDVATASRAIGRQFGPLARAAEWDRKKIAPAELDGRRTEHTADVDEATAFVFYPAPAWGAEEIVEHRVAEAMLNFGLAELDERERWITAASASTWARGERAPVMVASVSVADPARLDDAVAAVRDQVKKLGTEEPQKVAILGARLRTLYVADFDEFDGTGAWIADYLQYTDHKMFFLQELGALDWLGAAGVATYARDHFVDARSHVALVKPSGKPTTARRATVETARRTHDLEPWRTWVDEAEADQPLTLDATRVPHGVEELALDNGLRILLAPDPTSPVVDVRIVFPAGTSADPSDRPGVADLTAQVLDLDEDRLYTRDEVAVLDWTQGLGTELWYDVDETSTTFGARGLSTYADWHLWRLFWQLEGGVLDRRDLRRIQEQAAAAERSEGAAAHDRRQRVLLERLFGAGHPYADDVDAADLAKIGVGDLKKFRAAHYRARGATLIVAGGFEPEAFKAEIAELFAPWGGDGGDPAPELPEAKPAEGPSYLSVADDDATQVRIVVAFATRSRPDEDRAVRLVLEEMLSDRARVVREGLGAGYAVSVDYRSGEGGGVLAVDGLVDADRAGAALVALRAELEAVRTALATLRQDFVRARRRALARVLADSAGVRDLAEELEALAERGLPTSYFDQLVEEVGATRIDDVARLVGDDLDERRMVLLVSGPADAVDAAYQAAGLTAERLP